MKMRPVHAALLYFVLVAGAVPILIPFVWMLSTALKTKEAANEYPPRWLPEIRRSYAFRSGRRVEVISLVEAAAGQTKIRMPDGSTRLVPSSSVVHERKLEPQWRNFTMLAAHKSGDSDTDFPRF